MKTIWRARTGGSAVDWLAGRLLPAKEDLPTRILGEARRQGLKVVDRSAGAMLRLSLCVARRTATEPLPVAVAGCLRQRASRWTPRYLGGERLGRKRYYKWEVLEELRRQHVDLTNASAGWMMRFMACVSAQVLSQSLPASVQSCLVKHMLRAPARALHSVRRQRRH